MILGEEDSRPEEKSIACSSEIESVFKKPKTATESEPEMKSLQAIKYLGRIAPTPSGHMHVGHAQTFLIAKRRAELAGGNLVLRIEDLDSLRCKSQFYEDMLEDLKWMGISWQIGPEVESQSFSKSSSAPIHFLDFLTGACVSPNSSLKSSSSSSSSLLSYLPSQVGQKSVLDEYKQSSRMPLYFAAFQYLLKKGYIYPSTHSRKDVEAAVSAPHEGDVEVPFPVSLRPDYVQDPIYGDNSHYPIEIRNVCNPVEFGNVNWRFRVPDGEVLEFEDLRYGKKQYECGVDIGDFVLWRGSDHIPSYEFAVVVDDMAMGITEVVRGFDLLQSTARQLLIYRALDASLIPNFYHCPLIRDANGVRLAKRSFSQSIRTLRQAGHTIESIMSQYFDPQIVEEYWR